MHLYFQWVLTAQTHISIRDGEGACRRARESDGWRYVSGPTVRVTQISDTPSPVTATQQRTAKSPEHQHVDQKSKWIQTSDILNTDNICGHITQPQERWFTACKDLCRTLVVKYVHYAAFQAAEKKRQ